jgi:plastocyanin
MLRRASVFLLIFMGAGLLIRCGSTESPAGPGNPNPTPTPVATGDVIIAITGINGDNSFAPAAATVKVGQSVAWRNNDSTTHRVILTGVFDTKALDAGVTSVGTKMTVADTYSYICTIHPSMKGTVIVTP